MAGHVHDTTSCVPALSLSDSAPYPDLSQASDVELEHSAAPCLPLELSYLPRHQEVTRAFVLWYDSGAHLGLVMACPLLGWSCGILK